jgi:hypothetical protein
VRTMNNNLGQPNKGFGGKFCVFCHMRVLVTDDGYTMDMDGVSHHNCRGERL